MHEQAQDMPRPVPMDAVQFGPRGAQKPLASAPLIASTEHRRGAWGVVRRRNRVLTMEALPTADLQFGPGEAGVRGQASS